MKSVSLEKAGKNIHFNNTPTRFNTAVEGKQVHLFELKNKQGMSAYITNYGARLVSLFIADKNGKMTDIVQGFPGTKDYQNTTENHFGAPIDNFPEKKGPDDVVWNSMQFDQTTVEFTYSSIPGNLKIKVTYSLTEDNSIKISYDASSDKTKIINIANHIFFNLNGENSGTILNHRVQIRADYFIPVDSAFVPTGQIKNVTGTPFDFRKGFTIGCRVNDHSEQLQNGRGYHHSYVLNKHSKKSPVAMVGGDVSGIIMEVFTDQPGLQFNSGNFMHRKNTMKQGYRGDYRIAFVMNSQNLPDSLNQTKFPSTILKADQRYYSMTRYRFKVN